MQEHAVNDSDGYLEVYEDCKAEQPSEYESHPPADQEGDNVTGPQVYLEDGDDQTDDPGDDEDLAATCEQYVACWGPSRKLQVCATRGPSFHPEPSLRPGLELYHQHLAASTRENDAISTLTREKDVVTSPMLGKLRRDAATLVVSDTAAETFDR